MSQHTVGAIPSRCVLAVGDAGVALERELEPALLVLHSTAVLVVGSRRSVELLEYISLHYVEQSQFQSTFQLWEVMIQLTSILPGWDTSIDRWDALAHHPARVGRLERKSVALPLPFLVRRVTASIIATAGRQTSFGG